MKRIFKTLIAGALFLSLTLSVLPAQTAIPVAKGSKSRSANTSESGKTQESTDETESPQDTESFGEFLSTVGTGIDTSQTREDPALVALGSMGASNIYYSYLTIGAIADGFVGGTYQAKIAISVANEAIFMNDTSRASLEKLKNSALMADQDREVVVYLIETYEILNEQARALIQFISDRSNDGSEYQKYRKEAWNRIVSLFGLH